MRDRGNMYLTPTKNRQPINHQGAPRPPNSVTAHTRAAGPATSGTGNSTQQKTYFTTAFMRLTPFLQSRRQLEFCHTVSKGLRGPTAQAIAVVASQRAHHTDPPCTAPHPRLAHGEHLLHLPLTLRCPVHRMGRTQPPGVRRGIDRLIPGGALCYHVRLTSRFISSIRCSVARFGAQPCFALRREYRFSPRDASTTIQ